MWFNTFWKQNDSAQPITIAVAAPPQYDELPICQTPEMASLSELDLRATIQNSNLPTITGGTSSSSSQSSSSCQTSLSKQKVLLIGIDGLRADVAMIPLPNIRRLQSMGTCSFWADVQSTASAVSGPGWGSMFTGVEPSKHLVDGNNDLDDIAYPTVFKMVKDTFDKSVAASVSWDPLITDIIDAEDETTLDARFLGDYDDDAVAAKSVEWILSDEYDFIFAAFDGPDAAGHSSGFDGYLSSYQKSVMATDALVGQLLDAVLAASAGKEWLIILTSDHGGEGTNHGPSDAYNRKIPLLVSSNSPRVNIGGVSVDDPGSQMDVLPTIMHFFGGPSAVPDGLDGQVFGFKDYTRVNEIEEDLLEVATAPDPENCGCASSQQADYRGTIAETQSGLTCQLWDSQSPHSHDKTPKEYPSSGLEENYCRNPDEEPGAWCYTTNPDVRWELCHVPTCSTYC